ncbi:hypothetical protein IWQ57_006993, partial [Coemansia nantahalensis]
RRVCSGHAAVDRRDQAVPARVHVRGAAPGLPLGARARHLRGRGGGPAAAAPRPRRRQRHVGHGRAHPRVPRVPRKVHAARPQHDPWRRRLKHPERRVRGQEGLPL